MGFPKLKLVMVGEHYLIHSGAATEQELNHSQSLEILFILKRKAGQVYGVPLSGLQLAKPGIFPELKLCGEDFRKKWIEVLSQPHKWLRTLADHVPHGYKRSSLLEVLIKNNVPLVRATWFVKATYLNQVRPASVGISSGTADKIQLSCSELWTKDIIEYLQTLLDDFFSEKYFSFNSS